MNRQFDSLSLPSGMAEISTFITDPKKFQTREKSLPPSEMKFSRNRNRFEQENVQAHPVFGKQEVNLEPKTLESRHVIHPSVYARQMNEQRRKEAEYQTGTTNRTVPGFQPVKKNYKLHPRPVLKPMKDSSQVHLEKLQPIITSDSKSLLFKPAAFQTEDQMYEYTQPMTDSRVETRKKQHEAWSERQKEKKGETERLMKQFLLSREQN